MRFVYIISHEDEILFSVFTDYLIQPKKIEFNPDLEILYFQFFVYDEEGNYLNSISRFVPNNKVYLTKVFELDPPILLDELE